MKKIALRAILGAALAATALTPAFAAGPPTKSDPHPPGALYQSTPRGAAKDDPRGGKVNPPDDLRKRSAMHSSKVRLNTHSLHRGAARHRHAAPM